MRGERFPAGTPRDIKYGSSPHARGTRRYCCSCECIARFIPACAGNASHTDQEEAREAVHPRMRGERVVLRDGLSLLDGSSPHARGTREPVPGGDHPNRFIPACAGNAHLANFRCRIDTVHPRMRGERTVVSRSTRAAVGSSPHARGTQRHRRLLGLWRRFIPACAGNAVWLNAAPTRPTVHPRMRGERRQSVGLRGADGGSSPHARGTPMRSMACAIYQRFIPACAGNANVNRAGRASPAVHPRMRGERKARGEHIHRGDGSSPHARGTRTSWRSACMRTRFIPACAGNAKMNVQIVSTQTVHPRMRGERRAERGRTGSLGGSSPHARGTLSGGVCTRRAHRFIPACAGNAR